MSDNPNRFDLFGMTVSDSNGQGNYAEMFMTTGLSKKEAFDLSNLIMRTYIDSRKEATALTNFLSQCIFTKNTAGLQDLQNHLTAKAAIKGAARTYALQFGTGTLAPDTILDITDSKVSGLRRMFRRNKKYDNQNNGHQPPVLNRPSGQDESYM